DNQKRVAVRALHRGGRGLGTQRPGDRDVEQGVRGTPVSALTTDEDGHALKVLDATQLLPESRVSDDNGLLQVEVVPDLVQTQNLGEVVVGDARRSGRGVVVVRRVVGVHVALAKSRVDGDEGDGGAVRGGRGHTQGGVVEELPVGGRPVNALLVKDVDVGVNQVLLRDLHGAPELPSNQKNLVVQALVRGVVVTLGNTAHLDTGGPGHVAGVSGHRVVTTVALHSRHLPDALNNVGVPLFGNPVLVEVTVSSHCAKTLSGM